jgi:PAS domain S-box-containing protein
MKIRWKIFISVILITAALFLLVIMLLSNNFRNYSLNRTEELTQAYALQSANRAQAILEKDMGAMRTLADAFSGFDDIPLNVRKPIYEDMMRSVLENHPKYISVWASWELSAIDNNWLKNHGRQRTLLLRKPSGSIDMIIDSLELVSDNYESIYYKIKTSKRREFIVNPYFYTYESEAYTDSILETSIAVQIRENNQYRGLVGLDVKLTELQDIIESDLPLDSANMFLVSNNGTLVAHKDDALIGKSVTELFGKGDLSSDFLVNIEKGDFFSFISDETDSGQSYTAYAPFTVGESKTPWGVAVYVPLRVITKEAYRNFYDSLLIGLLGLLFLSGILFIISANITRPIIRTANLMHSLEKGDIRLRTDRSMARKDEVGEMTRSVRKLLEKLNETVQFAVKIGEGEFDAEYRLESENDRLGKALVDMQNNLKRIQREREEKEAENKRNIWLQSGITKLGEILQDNYPEHKSLTDVTLKFLVKHLDIPQAAIFIADYENEYLQQLTLSSAYAYGRKKNIQENFELGEGLVGRCAEEKKIILITDIPEDYTSIKSGLGEEKPTFLMLLPLINDRRVQGVIEIASFKKLPEHKQEFLEVSAERLAAEVLNISNDIETKKIMQQLEAQSDAMKEKEQQTREFIEKLESTSDILDKQRFENKMMVEALSSVTSVVFYDTEGRITDLNQKNQEMFGIKKEDYIGKTHFDILPDAKSNPEWFEQFWEDLRSGKTREKEYYIKNEEREMWLHETFIPIKNRKGEVVQIINIGIDITQQRLLERKLEELQNDN